MDAHLLHFLGNLLETVAGDFQRLGKLSRFALHLLQVILRGHEVIAGMQELLADRCIPQLIFNPHHLFFNALILHQQFELLHSDTPFERPIQGSIPTQ